MSKNKLELRIQRRYEKGDILLQNIKESMDGIEELLQRFKNAEEDRIYRFYHGSFKVYYFQE